MCSLTTEETPWRKYSCSSWRRLANRTRRPTGRVPVETVQVFTFDGVAAEVDACEKHRLVRFHRGLRPVLADRLARACLCDLVHGSKNETTLVQCFCVESGRLRLQREFPASRAGENNPSVSRAAPTAVVDDNGLTVFFESGDLHRLTLDGDVRWRKNLSPDEPLRNHHGLGSSLTQCKYAAIVLVEHGGSSFLQSVDKATGETNWKTLSNASNGQPFSAAGESVPSCAELLCWKEQHQSRETQTQSCF